MWGSQSGACDKGSKVVKVLHFFSSVDSWPKLASGGSSTGSGVPEVIGP